MFHFRLWSIETGTWCQARWKPWYSIWYPPKNIIPIGRTSSPFCWAPDSSSSRTSSWARSAPSASISKTWLEIVARWATNATVPQKPTKNLPGVHFTATACIIVSSSRKLDPLFAFTPSENHPGTLALVPVVITSTRIQARNVSLANEFPPWRFFSFLLV